MKSLSVNTVIEKNKLGGGEPFLICMEVDIKDGDTIVETLRIVRNNEDIEYQGNVYAAYPFDLNLNAEAGAIPRVTVTARDITRAIQGRLQNYKGVVGSDVRLFVVNAGNLAQPPEITEFFVITSTSTSGYDISIELGAENTLALPFPRRRQMRDRCNWKYKSAECGYTGALSSCDLSLQGDNGCAQHSNTLNFGGFPGIRSNGARYG